MNNKLWNISIPIKLFDEDITSEKFFDFLCTNEVIQEQMQNNTLFIIYSKTNDYHMYNLTDVIGKVNCIYMEGNDLFANVDILLFIPIGENLKKIYDMLYTDNNPIFYLTPHGMKNGNKITNINAFTLWHQPSQGSLGNMNMLEYEGDNIK